MGNTPVPMPTENRATFFQIGYESFCYWLFEIWKKNVYIEKFSEFINKGLEYFLI